MFFAFCCALRRISAAKNKLKVVLILRLIV